MEVPEEIRRNIRAVLLSKVGGVPLSKFPADYKKLLCEPLHYKSLGFSSLQDFLNSMPEVARIETTESGTKIYGVGEPNTYMPISARKAQGKLPKDYLKKIEESKKKDCSDSLSESSSVMDDNLEADHNGLYSVCMPADQCPTDNKPELETLFSQAGDVKMSNITQHWVFVRYATKAEVHEAVKLFGEEYSVRIARSGKKEKEKAEKENSSKKSQNDNRPAKANKKSSPGGMNGILQKKDMGRPHPLVNSVEGDRNHKRDSDECLSEKSLSNGFLSNGHAKISHKEEKSPAKRVTDGEVSGRTKLFVANVESEERFLELIEPYQPVDVQVRKKGKSSMIAFVRMRCEAEAQRVIKDLNNMKGKRMSLLVDFDKNQSIVDKTSSEDGDSESHYSDSYKASHKQRLQSSRMPGLQVDVSDMPPLVHESELGPEVEKYQLNCCVYVGNFPTNSLESTLRKMFEKYHVLDICMVNNGSGQGCTKAFLYLATVYDVILAVKEMNGCCDFGGIPIKVDVPFTNLLLKEVVKKAFSKQM